MAQTYEVADLLAKLAGMAYHEGQSVEHWQQLTGIDCRSLEPYIQIKNDLCYWTKMAAEVYGSYCDTIAQNWRAIGL